MLTIDGSLPSELAPLAWLVGEWEGTGVISYPVDDDRVEIEFAQTVSFAHQGLPYLQYEARSRRLDTDALISIETGFWRLARSPGPTDLGPGMLPATGSAIASAEELEKLRRDDGGFEVEASIVHPNGVQELYMGVANGPRIDLATDAVLRSPSAKQHSASTRMLGYVQEHLLWAWDIGTEGAEVVSHASARLAKREASDASGKS
ncbi:FABP family protein [uncultured Agrococcus sp.]|uniref:FABP family protein n=1 Tax=uncultured Agrococcus sp. TaxID=382258 RepID=UPI0025D7626E|nr:FABP family protein [uncultured Agrococcus sp.]